ncbi:hypothetical protein D3C71_1638800 [compost metagenome]
MYALPLALAFQPAKLLYPACVDPALVGAPPNPPNIAVRACDAAARIARRAISSRMELAKSVKDNLPVVTKSTRASSMPLNALVNNSFDIAAAFWPSSTYCS